MMIESSSVKNMPRALFLSNNDPPIVDVHQ